MLRRDRDQILNRMKTNPIFSCITWAHCNARELLQYLVINDDYVALGKFIHFICNNDDILNSRTPNYEAIQNGLKLLRTQASLQMRLFNKTMKGLMSIEYNASDCLFMVKSLINHQESIQLLRIIENYWPTKILRDVDNNRQALLNEFLAIEAREQEHRAKEAEPFVGEEETFERRQSRLLNESARYVGPVQLREHLDRSSTNQFYEDFSFTNGTIRHLKRNTSIRNVPTVRSGNTVTPFLGAIWHNGIYNERNHGQNN